jgi:hypothetical protein
MRTRWWWRHMNIAVSESARICRVEKAVVWWGGSRGEVPGANSVLGVRQRRSCRMKIEDAEALKERSKADSLPVDE